MTLFGGVIPVTGITFFMFCIFAIIAVGYSLGRITVKGVSLGDAAVFIVALIFGCFLYDKLDAQLVVKSGEEVVHYTSSALKIVENLGLILFVTAVGFIAGPKFFGNMKKNFKSYVLIGLVVILAGGLAAVACIYFGRMTGVASNNEELTAMVVGLLSGSLTSTPAFSAAKSTVSAEYESAVAVGHGIAYIFGVIGVVLFVQLIPKMLHADMKTEREKLVIADSGKEKKKFSGKLLDIDGHGLMAFSLAAVLGTFIGMIKIPLSGKGLSGTCFSLTTTGGCLLVALILGHFGRCGRINLMPKDSTLKIFRELGLIFFLIGAGIAGGAGFLELFDVQYFFYGVFMTVVPMIAGFLFAKYVLRLSLLNSLGSLTGGMTSTPALGTLINVSGTEDVASAYAATYPVALIAVVLVSQFLIVLF